METFVVYGLVVIFFLFLFVAVGPVLASQSDKESGRTAQKHKPATYTTRREHNIAYGIFSLLFLSLFTFTWLSEGRRTRRRVHA